MGYSRESSRICSIKSMIKINDKEVTNPFAQAIILIGVLLVVVIVLIFIFGLILPFIFIVIVPACILLAVIALIASVLFPNKRFKKKR